MEVRSRGTEVEDWKNKCGAGLVPVLFKNRKGEKSNMNITCGTDIIEVERIKTAIENLGDKFLNEVYTKKEIEYCKSKNTMQYQHFAARFAGKEAIFKAISTTLKSKYDITWTDIEILNNKEGRPYIILNKEKIGQELEIDISLSHIKDYAIANCVAKCPN